MSTGSPDGGQHHSEPLDPDPHGRDPEGSGEEELDQPDPGDVPDA